jgi:hypothetical protein
MERATNPMKQTWASRSKQRVHTPPRQFGGAMPRPLRERLAPAWEQSRTKAEPVWPNRYIFFLFSI